MSDSDKVQSARDALNDLIKASQAGDIDRVDELMRKWEVFSDEDDKTLVTIKLRKKK